MARKITILDCILEVLSSSQNPLKSEEILNQIQDRGLYQFNSSNPLKMVRYELWNREISSNSRGTQEKIFRKVDRDTYALLVSTQLTPETQVEIDLNQIKIDSSDRESENSENITTEKAQIGLDLEFASLEDIYSEYIRAFKLKVLTSLKQLDPYEFEFFGKILLEKYGFQNVVVTTKSGDGGIDGYGDLEMGMGSMKFGFQCKRYDTSLITPIQLREFRGSLDENGLSQGIFFTTSRFSKTAKEAAEIPGARPIMLFDGEEIVNLMLKKSFGVSISRNLPIYEYTLDITQLRG
jgi:restriction system protein